MNMNKNEKEILVVDDEERFEAFFTKPIKLTALLNAAEKALISIMV